MNWKKIAENPLMLAGSAVVLMIVLLVGAYVFDGVLFTLGAKFPFLLASFISFIMAIATALVTLASKNVDSHMTKSIGAYILTVLVTGGIALLVAGSDELDGFGRIYIVISFCFLVIISILGAIRNLVVYAENEEWNAPKKNQKKQL